MAFPVGNDTSNGIEKVFGAGKKVWIEVLIFGVISGVARVIWGKGRGASTSGTTPELNLLVTIFGAGVGFIETLKSAVMAFVELPSLFDRDVKV